jgi:hypothetical protein
MNKILSAAFLIAACTACASEELTCPQPLSIKESLSAEAPAGWTARSTGTQRYLAGVSFYDGDPSKDFNLAPDNDKPSGKERIATWTFGKRAEPIWLVCRYLDTGMVLQKPLAKGLAQCQVRYKEGGIVVLLSCK